MKNMAICPHCNKKIKSIYIGSLPEVDEDDTGNPDLYNDQTGECPECGEDILLMDLFPPDPDYDPNLM